MKVPWLLSAAACAIGLLVGAPRGQLKSEVGPMTSSASQTAIEGTLPSLEGAIEWLNTSQLLSASVTA